jgi:hypothetical protein
MPTIDRNALKLIAKACTPIPNDVQLLTSFIDEKLNEQYCVAFQMPPAHSFLLAIAIVKILGVKTAEELARDMHTMHLNSKEHPRRNVIIYFPSWQAA